MKTSIKAINKNGRIKMKIKGKTIELIDLIAIILCKLIIKNAVTNEDDLFDYIKNQMRSFKKILQSTEKGGVDE